jgi:hypothetical protein
MKTMTDPSEIWVNACAGTALKTVKAQQARSATPDQCKWTLSFDIDVVNWPSGSFTVNPGDLTYRALVSHIWGKAPVPELGSSRTTATRLVDGIELVGSISRGRKGAVMLTRWQAGQPSRDDRWWDVYIPSLHDWITEAVDVPTESAAAVFETYITLLRDDPHAKRCHLLRTAVKLSI